MIIVTSSFSDFYVQTKTESRRFQLSYFDLKIFFGKIRFRNGLVWTVGQTEEIELRFQTVETTYITGILCHMKHLCTVDRRQNAANFIQREMYFRGFVLFSPGV